MHRSRATGALLLLLAGVWQHGGRCAETSPEGVARGLQAWLDGTRDLKCRFEQSLDSGALGAGVPESGSMLLLRPGRARWDYAEPERKIAILDGDSTRVYLPADRQMIRGTLPAEGQALHALLTRRSRVEEMFVPSLLPAVGGRGIRLRLVPRGKGESFEAVVLDLDPSSFAIRAAEVADGSGNVVRYRFYDMQRNRGVGEESFHFQPPPGTEILEAP